MLKGDNVKSLMKKIATKIHKAVGDRSPKSTSLIFFNTMHHNILRKKTRTYFVTLRVTSWLKRGVHQ